MRVVQAAFFLLVVRPLLALVLGVNLRHAERLPQAGPAILAANHNSHLDTLLLMSLYPQAQLHRLRPVAAADYFLQNRVVAWFALNVMHILPLARRPKPGEPPLAHLEAALAAGDILILFPEGSRGEPEKRSVLKTGIAHLMEHAPAVPVVPIYLHGLGKALPRGDWLPVPFFADGFVGEPLTWQGSRADTMRALEGRFVELEREGGIRCVGMNSFARYENPALVALTLLALVASGTDPFDRPTWFLETFPVMLGVPLLIATHRRFPLTPLVYRLLFAHGLILMLGGAYTYARVPLGFWLQDALELARNNYDRLGHLVQGFVPAMLVREILVRATPLCPGGWLFFLTTCVALAISASYEFIEWGVALVMGMDADAFLATQGDVWDTQWDMFLALLGALAAQILLSRRHDRQLARLI